MYLSQRVATPRPSRRRRWLASARRAAGRRHGERRRRRRWPTRQRRRRRRWRSTRRRFQRATRTRRCWCERPSRRLPLGVTAEPTSKSTAEKYSRSVPTATPPRSARRGRRRASARRTPASCAPTAGAAAAAPCEDKSDSCKAWTKAGECERNREFMHAECRRSCNLCVEPTNLFRNPNPKPPATKPVPEEQKPTTEQEAKQRRHLEAPGTSTPPKQLGTGSPAAKATVKCADSNARCPDWAKAGECPRNAAFMRANCPLSCDLCGESRFQKLATMP